MGIIGELRKCLVQICIDFCAFGLMLGDSIFLCMYVTACCKNVRKRERYFRFQSNMEFKCSQCSKSYSTKKSLDNHTRMQHGNPKQFQCTHCDYMTLNNGHLELHIRSQHKNIKELCSGCGKQFSNQSNVYRHKRKLHCTQTISYSLNRKKKTI